MKLTWNDAKPYFEEQTIWTHKQALHWYQYVWELLDNNNLTIHNSPVEKLAVYSRLYAVVKIYREFCQAGFEESPDFDIYFDELTDDKEKQDIYNELIKDSSTMKTIFELLQENLGREQTFISLWITCRPDELEDDIDTFEDYNNTLSRIMNENMSIEKLSAYDWLANQM